MADVSVAATVTTRDCERTSMTYEVTCAVSAFEGGCHETRAEFRPGVTVSDATTSGHTRAGTESSTRLVSLIGVTHAAGTPGLGPSSAIAVATEFANGGTPRKSATNKAIQRPTNVVLKFAATFQD
ncbi:unannotated protein [freshwater metagenome]|uniref:Unannotated protein n=1 Tax=freshwater metagenome TaxID=449393 RepID=A0A6J6ENQ4_9ZZZZ